MQGGRVHLDCVRSALRAQGGRGIESRFCGAVGYRYQQNARTKRDVLLLPSQEKSHERVLHTYLHDLVARPIT